MKHTLDEVLRSLARKKDVKISNNTILLLSDKAPNKSYDLGNGSFGKIDYLVKVHKYQLKIVDTFEK